MRRRLISEIWKLLETKTCPGGGKRGKRGREEGGGRREKNRWDEHGFDSFARLKG